MKGINFFLNPHFFVSMATVARFLYEYHMTWEVVSLSVDFFKMAVVAMETNKILKN
jgi:hypothetical protein